MLTAFSTFIFMSFFVEVYVTMTAVKKYIFNKNMFSVQFQGWNNRLCRFAEGLFDDTRSQIQICNEQQPASGDIHICTVFHRRLLE
jgi:hypothetical protein